MQIFFFLFLSYVVLSLMTNCIDSKCEDHNFIKRSFILVIHVEYKFDQYVTLRKMKVVLKVNICNCRCACLR